MDYSTDPGYHRWQLELFRSFLGMEKIPVWDLRRAQAAITNAESADLQALYELGSTPGAAAYFMGKVHRWQRSTAAVRVGGQEI